jgi:hypothetical protein
MGAANGPAPQTLEPAINYYRDGALRQNLSAPRHMLNIDPSFMARPMSPLSFSLPDMNSI